MRYFTLKLVILVIIMGFILAFFINMVFSKGLSCSASGCLCPRTEGYIEHPCSKCTSSDYVFVLGILNVKRDCQADEITFCENGISVGMEVRDKRCRFAINGI